MPNNQLPWEEGLGARIINDPGQLLETQSEILKRVLRHIYDIASREAARETTPAPGGYQKDQQGRRPHQVFMIDGARGAGKTSLLLTARHYIGELGRRKPNTTGWSAHPVNELYTGTKASNEDFSAPHKGPEADRATAVCLPVLFPSDLEFTQSVMEGLIALMIQTIDDSLAEKEKTDPEYKRREAAAKALKKQATDKVAKGWFLSRNAGNDAILRDSADYEDYLTRRSEANVASFGRVPTWRAFVNAYLNHFGSQVLAVFLDDTDLSPETTRDILHTLRIFLDHPRIVTVIAGNMRAMRESVLLEGLGKLSAPIASLTGEAEATARNWRLAVRRQSEESLDKVLPRQFRYFIKTDTAPKRLLAELSDPADPKSSKTGGRSVENDFAAIFHRTFDKFTDEALDDRRDAYLQAKQKAYWRLIHDREEIANDTERQDLEAFVAWWLFKHWYGEYLRPRAIRHMLAMRSFMSDPHASSKSDGENQVAFGRKRLAVMLFESPANHELIQRISDDDKSALPWLRRQRVQSSWRDGRYIEINGQRIHQQNYSYHYLMFRIDLGIAMPVHANPDDWLPQGILPKPSGPNLIGRQPFFPRTRYVRPYGVSIDFEHSLMPPNCIFLFDVASLPDIAWEPPPSATSQAPQPDDIWGTSIIYNLDKYFNFNLDELEQSGADIAVPSETEQQSDADKSEDHNPDLRAIRAYLRQVVLPLSSLVADRFVTPPQDEHYPKTTVSDIADRLLLKAERDEKFFKDQRDPANNIRRRFDYFMTLTKKSEISELAAYELMNWRAKFLNQIIPEPKHSDEYDVDGAELKGRALRAHLQDYQWLINDMRRAWHAARIFLSQTSRFIKVSSTEATAVSEDAERYDLAGSTPEITPADLFFPNDRYIIVTRAAIKRWLTRSPTIKRLWKHSNELDTNNSLRGTVQEAGEFRQISPKDFKSFVHEKIRELVGPQHSAGVNFDVEDGGIAMTPNALRAFIKATAHDFRERKSDGTLKTNWPLLIDPSLKESPDGEEINPNWRPETLVRGRLARSLLLFFYGIAPTLPSLIHIEIASYYRNMETAPESGGNISKDDIENALEAWEQRITEYINFVQQYRVLLEIMKFRLDILELIRATTRWSGNHVRKPEDQAAEVKALGLPPLTAKEFGVAMTLTPDMSFESVGVEGLRLFRPKDQSKDWIELSEALGPDGRTDRLCSLSEELNRALEAMGTPKSRARKWPPIIEATVVNLVESLNFIQAIRLHIGSSPTQIEDPIAEAAE